VFLTRIFTFAGMKAVMAKWMDVWVEWVGGWLERSVLLTTFVVPTCYEPPLSSTEVLEE
jgi:hypothetical protein